MRALYICHMIVHSTIPTQNCQSVHALLTSNVLEEHAAITRKSYVHRCSCSSQCNWGSISCPSSCSLLLKGHLPRNLYIIVRQMMDEHVPLQLRLIVFIKQAFPSLYKLRIVSMEYNLLQINENYRQHPESVGSDTTVMITKHFISNKLVTWITHTIYILTLTFMHA